MQNNQKKLQNMKSAIHAVLLVLIACLIYFLYQSIMEPIRFNKERDFRYAKGIERLKQIRTAQVAFKLEYGHYTSSFDSLIGYVKEGKFKVVRMEIDESDPEDLSKTVAKDTTLVSIKDSLFKNVYVDSLRYVPFSSGKEISMAANLLATGSKVVVPVFEASIKNDDLLAGLDPQLVINFNYDREEMVGFAGLKVGSVTEANNNAGNWE